MTKKILFISLFLVLAGFAWSTPKAQANTAPTFVGNSSSSWNNTGKVVTTGNVNTNSGDTLVVYAVCESDTGNCGATSVTSTPSLTWVLQKSLTGTSFAETYIWTSTSTANGNVQVSCKITVGTKKHGCDLLVFRNVGGVGNSAANSGSSGLPTVNVSTTANDSAIVVVNGDFTGGLGAGTFATVAGSFTKLDDHNSDANYDAYGGYYSDASSTQTYSTAMTAPSGQKWQVLALEIKGTTGPSTPDATSLSTTVGGDGGRSGDSITITGSNFGTVSAGSRATCNGGAGTGCIQFISGGNDTVPDASISAWSNTSITFAVPSGLNSNGGANAVQVWAANASDTTPLTFYIYPNISTVQSFGSNAARTYNASDTDGTVMLVGDHFGTTTGTSTILGVLAALHNSTSTECTASGFASTTACFEVPSTIASATYSGTIILTRASDSKQATTSLSILPRITSLNPISGYGGQLVQILGDHLCQGGTCPVSPNRSTSTTNVSFGVTKALDSDFVAQTGGGGTCNGSGAAWTHGEICVDVPGSAPVSTLSVLVTSNNSTSTSYSFTVTTPPAPGAPGTPTYSSVNSSTLTIGWSAASGAVSYYTAQRSTSSAFTSPTSLATTTATSTGDSGLLANTTYYYRAFATNAGGNSPNSATSSVLTLPDAPGTPSFSSVTTSTLTVSWAAPTGGATYYTAQRSTSSAFASVTTLASTTATSSNDSGLRSNTTYYYRAKATNATGDGAWSASSTVTTNAIVNNSPSAPTETSPDGLQDVPTLPVFTLSATDPDSDNVQYKIVVYSDSGCNTAVATYDQSSSQTGWSGQNASSSKEYTSGTQGTYTAQVALSANTTYYWKASAKDPEGSNAFGSAGTCKNFTTTAGSWTTDSGSWSISSNQLTVTPSAGSYAQIHVSSISSQTNAVIEFQAQASAASGNIEGIVHANSGASRYDLVMGDFSNAQTTIAKISSGAYTSLASGAVTLNSGTNYFFRGSISGSSLSSWINGASGRSANDSALSAGFVGIGASSTNGTTAYTFTYFSVYSGTAVAMNNLPSGGSWAVLTSGGSTVGSCQTGSSLDLSTYNGEVPVVGGSVQVWNANNTCSGGSSATITPSVGVFGGDTYSYSTSGGTILTGGGVPAATSTITVNSAGSVSY